MKKQRYRIIIKTKRNGEKLYNAQIKMIKKDLIFNLIPIKKWRYIDNWGCDSYYEYCYPTIVEVENAINKYKKIKEEKFQDEIINVEYKYID